MDVAINISGMTSYVYYLIMLIKFNGVPLVYILLAIFAVAMFIEWASYLVSYFAERLQ